jgi:S1-C subfamily serine protease
MFEGSPAERAGIRAKGKLQWQHAVAGLLALSPAAPLAVPLIMSTAKGSGPGDIVLAVDGERVKKREEFEQIMRRFEPGDMVYLSVLRRGSTLRVPVKLGQHPSVEDPSTSLAEATTTKGKKVYLY